MTDPMDTTPLRMWRLGRGISLRELELRTGINRGVLSNYERGLRVPPAAMAKIAEALSRKEGDAA